MTRSRRLVFATLLFLIYAKANAKWEHERDRRNKEDPFINREIEKRIQSTTSKIVTKPNIRPNISNTPQESLFKTRHRRESNHKPDITALRMRLNQDRLRLKDLMASDADPRMEPNGTWPRNQEPHYGGINKEQTTGRRYDSIKKVYEYRNLEKDVGTVDRGTECDFEDNCRWSWKTDMANRFFITTPANYTGGESGPETDADNNEKGHFLMIRIKPSSSSKETDWNWTITSPMFDPSSDNCKIQLWIYQQKMNESVIRIVLHNINKTQVMVDQIRGEESEKWIKYEKAIGKTTQKFKIMLEVVVPRGGIADAAVAFDSIKLLKCYPETDRSEFCTPNQYRCATTNVCINNSEVCDITQDCTFGDDEAQNCDKIPYGARCNFEQDWCGWYNAQGKAMKWTRHNGSTATNLTGPAIDHTYGNSTGRYLHVTVAMGRDAVFASTATLKSVIFNPPPRVHGNSSSRYYNSCTIRFYLHQSGNHKSGFMLQVTELRPKENVSTELLWSYNNFAEPWIRQVAVLPNITSKYYVHFDFRKGIRYVRDIAIDDFSLSPECFGLNIPGKELNGYNYYNPVEHPLAAEPHKSFVNMTYYEIKTCNATGRYGPTQDNCTTAYSGTPIKVNVLRDTGFNGVQRWTVPGDNYYTFILYGASGGKGSGGVGSSRGAMSRVVLELRKGQEIYMLVGQEGTSSCVKSLGPKSNSSCQSPEWDNTTISGVRKVLNLQVNDGGGGGGGGTFMFLRIKNKPPIPLAVAAGGGGLGLGRFIDTGLQHGQAINTSRPPVTGQMYGANSAGAGGGWEMHNGQIDRDHEARLGQALLTGAVGGKACYESLDNRGDGGYGGGGGGCVGGGGGGGYSGGYAWPQPNITHGGGGYSYIDSQRTLPNLSEALSGYHSGAGLIVIVPANPGCGCDYRCVALDARRSQTACICPKDWKLGDDRKSCVVIDPVENYPKWFMILLIVIVVLFTTVVGGVCFMMYNRYQQKAKEVLRRKMLSGPDLQLNRLRIASDSMMTEYNPNYEFGGVVYTLKDLKDIPRDQLRLVKALGQGAFGEVYQGFYRQRSGDTVEMPVAVKTLPEMSTNQAEMDFLMEALIMSKFNHPNIVHFIGVCFDKHPRFIVLELLAGGDLKNFLRESRPKPERGTPLTMKDLVLIAVDVAKGCKYLEDNRFIHRDIAARNCLLTTKGPGRVVKIADFGMSRDIYRSDYYRKGGKAMLPIKWMPPEAFLDGIFTSKTDVWSFGVLLWEILSMGYMPYTGCANRDVMQLVTSGGRLEPPANCPGPLYGIMTQCWHPTPEQRPTFALIMERLGYCVQDPQVMGAPLPVFNRPPSHERDATLMRPNTSDDNCLQVPHTTDYLIPNHTMSLNPTNVVGSSSSIDKLLPENQDSWETSFVMPQSKSTQPLLQETENNTDEAAGSVEKLLTVDPQPKQAPSISPIPNCVQNNHNNNLKSETNLKSGISLDAGALVKQTMPTSNNPTKYSNAKSGEVTGNGVIQNGPYSNQNNYTSEISC